MPAAHGRSSSVFLNAYNVSAFLSSFDSTQTVDTAEVTTFGSTSKSFVTGLRDGTITLGGYFDGGAAALDEIMTMALNDQQVSYTAQSLVNNSNSPVNYGLTQNFISTTPISGFTISGQISDNTQGYAYKSATLVAGRSYIISAFIQMLSGAAPRIDPLSTRDFELRIEQRQTVNQRVTLITGQIYWVTAEIVANGSSTWHGILKDANCTTNGFKVSGLSLHEVNTQVAPTTIPLSICEDGALTIGNRCLVASVIDTSYQITGSISEAVSISAEFQSNGDGASGAYRGIILAPLSAYSHNQTTTAVDNSASTSNGLVANLHVIAGGSGASNVPLAVKIQHSTDGSNWQDLITFDAGSIIFSQHKVSTGIVHQYLRVSLTTFGRPVMLVTVARK